MDTVASQAVTGSADPATDQQPGRTRRWLAYALRRHGYLLVQGPLTTIGLLLVVLGLATSTLTLWMVIGVAFLVATLALSRAFGDVQRQVANALLGSEVAAPPAPVADAWRSVRGFLHRLKDPVAWRATAYHLVAYPVAFLGSMLVVAAWFLFLSSIFTLLPVGTTDVEFGPLLAWLQGHLGDGLLLDLVWGLVLAVVALVGMAAATGVGNLLELLTRGLLGPTRGQRLRQLEERRSALVDDAAGARRRIERDLHDGAQMHLTSLAMELGEVRAALREGSSPEELAPRVATAHEQAKTALGEVRDLARGVHPAILTDRGLEPALSSLTARTPVPTTLHVDLPERPSPGRESIAYFAVAEALTNVVRHSGARAAHVELTRRGDDLVIEVSDDGRGGADPGRGTGLDGIAARVRAVDGELTLTSPVGGPTTVRVELPCAS